MLINDAMPIGSVSFTSLEPVARQSTINNRDIVTKQSSQKWQFTITTPVMTQSEFLATASFLTRQANGFGEFQFKLPFANIFGDVNDAIVNASVQAGTDVVSIAPHGKLASGTFIKFANHSKIYQVALSRTNQIDFYPPLVSDVPMGTRIIVNQPVATVRMAGDLSPISIGADNLASKFDVSLLEVI